MRETDRVIGFRETVKMLKKDRVSHVVLANDSDVDMKEEISNWCKARKVPIKIVVSKAKLGQSCGIERPAAVMAFLTDQAQDHSKS